MKIRNRIVAVAVALLLAISCVPSAHAYVRYCPNCKEYGFEDGQCSLCGYGTHGENICVRCGRHLDDAGAFSSHRCGFCCHVWWSELRVAGMIPDGASYVEVTRELMRQYKSGIVPIVRLPG